MVPARLTLKNFLCYGENCPELDFEGIQLACLSGDNGNGKSALLDAITWALWGEARAKEIDALIHAGRTSMAVDFEFMVGPQRYRVTRTRERGKGKGGGRTNLFFYIQNGGTWITHSGSTVRETQHLIRRTIKLSYDTFINSALLVQGRADLFTAAGPARRKEVLSEILDLAQYDACEARAKELRNERAREAAAFEPVLRRLEAEAALIPQHEQSVAGLQADLRDVVQARARITADLDVHRLAQQALDRQRAELKTAREERDRLARALADIQRNVQEVRARIQRDEQVTATADAVRDGYQRLTDARATLERGSLLLQQMRTLEQRRREAEVQIQREEVAAQSKLQSIEDNFRQAERAAALVSQYEADLQAAEHESAALQADEAEALAQTRKAQDLRQQVAALQAEEKQLLASARENKRRYDELNAALAHGEAQCPLCHTQLGQNGLNHIKQEYEAQGKAESARVREIRESVQRHEDDAARLDRAAETLKREHELNRRRLDGRLAEARLLLQQVKEAATHAESLRAEREVWVERMTSGTLAAQARQECARIDKEIAALGYDPAVHRAASERVKQLAPYEERMRDLQSAEGRLQESRLALANQTKILQDTTDLHGAAEARVCALQTEVEAQPDLSDRIRVLERDLSDVTARESALTRALGAAEEALKRARDAAESYADQRLRYDAARREEEIYATLVRDFGRSGVQAMIIDAVLPEVEREANRLLGRMTNGRMSLQLSTQRERASGAAETLDIRIADEWGERDYDLFSGGEAFRINLALRIALSKLLARRAGAPLPTLVIDEGFGTQDAAGRERLIEAITAIQHDFECLLVVTHVDELKAMFETRIEVNKAADGSVARVVVG